MVPASGFGSGQSPAAHQLDVLILYEDFGTAVRAKQALDLLPDPASADSGLSTRLWKLELLSEPLFQEQAAIEAAAADVIVLSVHGHVALPAAAVGWMHRWLDHKERRPYALCVLLDAAAAGQGADNPVVGCVRKVADAAGADLFYGFYTATESGSNSAGKPRVNPAGPTPAGHKEIVKHANPRPCWGLNEKGKPTI